MLGPEDAATAATAPAAGVTAPQELQQQQQQQTLAQQAQLQLLAIPPGGGDRAQGLGDHGHGQGHAAEFADQGAHLHALPLGVEWRYDGLDASAAPSGVYAASAILHAAPPPPPDASQQHHHQQFQFHQVQMPPPPLYHHPHHHHPIAPIPDMVAPATSGSVSPGAPATPDKDTDGMIKCPHCPKTFARTNHLTKHLWVHIFKRPFRCDICRLKFHRAVQLGGHMRTTHGLYNPGRSLLPVVANSNVDDDTSNTLLRAAELLNEDDAEEQP